jgi:hypothetical protein
MKSQRRARGAVTLRDGDEGQREVVSGGRQRNAAAAVAVQLGSCDRRSLPILPIVCTGPTGDQQGDEKKRDKGNAPNSRLVAGAETTATAACSNSTGRPDAGQVRPGAATE